VVTQRKAISGIETSAPKTQTESRRRLRSIAYSDAMLTVEWLNATQRTAAYQRVLVVRRELEDLGRLLKGLKEQEQAREQRQKRFTQKPLEPIPENFPPVESIRAIAEAHIKPREQFRERHNAFNKLIGRYTLTPLMEYSPKYDIWRFNAVPKGLRGPKIIIDGIRVDESTVVAALCRLAARRELYKVRLCELCRECWRVSEREMDKFCSQKCREAFYAQSSDFRDRKAKNQQKYRENMKSRKWE
jgi:hypothetical protein